MIPESLRRTQRALRLSVRKYVLKETLSAGEELELARLDTQAERQVRECIKAHERQSRALRAHQKRTKGLSIGTYGSKAA